MKASGGLQEVRHAGDLQIWTDTPSDAVQIEEPHANGESVRSGVPKPPAAVARPTFVRRGEGLETRLKEHQEAYRREHWRSQH